MKTVRFDALKIGRIFEMNGNTWEKVSTRTAKIIKPARHAGTWFYFSGADICTPQGV